MRVVSLKLVTIYLSIVAVPIFWTLNLSSSSDDVCHYYDFCSCPCSWYASKYHVWLNPDNGDLSNLCLLLISISTYKYLCPVIQPSEIYQFRWFSVAGVIFVFEVWALQWNRIADPSIPVRPIVTFFPTWCLSVLFYLSSFGWPTGIVGRIARCHIRFQRRTRLFVQYSTKQRTARPI